MNSANRVCNLPRWTCTTVNYKVEKRQALEEELAELLKTTIPVDACENVNLVLASGFSENIELAVAGLDPGAFLISDQQEKYKKVWLINQRLTAIS